MFWIDGELVKMADSLPFMTGAEPFFYQGNSVGVLCIHGFTASPAEVRWLGQHLAAQGWTVYGPRLPGHGTHYRDIERMRWRDWYYAGLDGLYLLRQQCEQVFLVGHSMGGLIALLLAASQPVDGLAVLASPLFVPARRASSARWIKHVYRYRDAHDRTGFPKRLREEQARRGEPVLGRVRYDRWSVAAVAELYAVMQAARRSLPNITVPLLTIYSESDQTVPLDNQRQIAASVRSAVLEQHTIKASDHIITQDVEHDEVFRRVAEFIARQSGSRTGRFMPEDKNP